MSSTQEELRSPTGGIALTPHVRSLTIAPGSQDAALFEVLALGQADEIDLSLGALPRGVTAQISRKTVAHNNSDHFTVSISAATDAAPFSGNVQVTATGGTTHPAHATLALTVS